MIFFFTNWPNNHKNSSRNTKIRQNIATFKALKHCNITNSQNISYLCKGYTLLKPYKIQHISLISDEKKILINLNLLLFSSTHTQNKRSCSCCGSDNVCPLHFITIGSRNGTFFTFPPKKEKLWNASSPIRHCFLYKLCFFNRKQWFLTFWTRLDFAKSYIILDWILN